MANRRKLYLCSYDVSDDKRRTRLFQLLHNHGEHVQYSVFLCQLDKTEKIALLAKASDILHADADQLLVVAAGSAEKNLELQVVTVGRPWRPMIRSHIF